MEQRKGFGLKNKVYLKKGWTEDAIDLLEGMLEYDPEKRWTWNQCLESNFMKGDMCPIKQMPVIVIFFIIGKRMPWNLDQVIKRERSWYKRYWKFKE